MCSGNSLRHGRTDGRGQQQKKKQISWRTQYSNKLTHTRPRRNAQAGESKKAASATKAHTHISHRRHHHRHHCCCCCCCRYGGLTQLLKTRRARRNFLGGHRVRARALTSSSSSSNSSSSSSSSSRIVFYTLILHAQM